MQYARNEVCENWFFSFGLKLLIVKFINSFSGSTVNSNDFYHDSNSIMEKLSSGFARQQIFADELIELTKAKSYNALLAELESECY